MGLAAIARRLPPRPIAHYALALLLVLVLALVVFAALVRHDTARLQEQVARSDEMLARQELEEAIVLLSRQVDEVAGELVQWDEARQQLDDPTYYAYWRNVRVSAAGVLPVSGALDGLDLYDRQGNNLSTDRRGEAAMPAHVDTRDLRPFLRHESGRDRVYFFHPFYQDAAHTVVIGYAGIRYDFQLGLDQLRKFRYLDIDSVHVVSREGEAFPLEGVLSALQLKARANPETRALEEIIIRSFYEMAAILAVVSLIGYLALVSAVTKPLRRLSDHIEGMRRGTGGMLDASYRGMLAVTELENVRQSLNDYQGQLDDMHLSLAGKNRELWALAHCDPLTGIFNRRAFEDDWRVMRRASNEKVLSVAFLLFDCDHFKAINDTYGHQVGDQVIRSLAESLRSGLRVGDRLYRLGGDEFATTLISVDVDGARQVAERCVEQVLNHDFTALGVKEPVRISVGIAVLEATGDGVLQQLHRQADIAMYHAKRPGQSKITVYTPEMGAGQDVLVSNAETSAVFEAMVDPGRLEIHYQPVLALAARRVEYYEALVRIRTARDLIMPASIFPLVELRGLETELDLAVLERVRRDLEAGRIPSGAGVALNVSGPGIVNARVIDKLLDFAPLLPACKLVLEVTETSLITQIAQATANLNRLRKEGFTIALDDFGSGYSSLRYLSNMPVDLVKFDISMVHSLERPGRQAVLVEDLARLIRDAGYQLVAEGVESESLLQRVAALGFSHAQGFHIGRAAPLMAPVASGRRDAG
ncbi:MAG TPA: EAL domain-containing protein [Thiobacillaceae bacterium]|nr:EAL domain-containing protein [Thiobacillaceae bacterium]